MEYATQACELTGWKDAQSITALAAAYAESRKFSDAVKWQQNAIDFAPADERANYQDYLNLYKNGKPYREQPAKPPTNHPRIGSRVLPSTAFFSMNLITAAGHVDLAGLLDAFEPRRGIDFHHHGAMIRSQQVDAGDGQAHRFGGAQRRSSVLQA